MGCVNFNQVVWDCFLLFNNVWESHHERKCSYTYLQNGESLIQTRNSGCIAAVG